MKDQDISTSTISSSQWRRGNSETRPKRASGIEVRSRGCCGWKNTRRVLGALSDTGAFSSNGGGVAAVEGDFEFYGFAGTIKGDLSKLKVEDYWHLAPLDKALNKLGRM